MEKLNKNIRILLRFLNERHLLRKYFHKHNWQKTIASERTYNIYSFAKKVDEYVCNTKIRAKITAIFFHLNLFASFHEKPYILKNNETDEIDAWLKVHYDFDFFYLTYINRYGQKKNT